MKIERVGTLGALAGVWALVALGCGGASAPPPSTQASGWDAQRAERAAEHRDYIALHQEDFDWFANFANGYSGVPFLLLRALPELDPETWGPVDERYARFGFQPDTENPGRPLPRGLGWATVDGKPYDPQSPRLHVVTLTCGGCHIGRVRTAPNTYQDIVGGPNTQIDVRRYRHAFEQTVARLLGDPAAIDKTADALVELVKSKPPTYFYNEHEGFDAAQEASQRAILANKDVVTQILTGFAGAIRVGQATVAKQRATSYAAPNAPSLDGGSVGQSDGSGDLIPKLLMLEHLDGKKAPAEVQAAVASFTATDFPALPRNLATVTDILSTWKQVNRPLAQIDGSVKSPYFRNVAAILAIVGNPKLLNYENAEFSARFIHDLPPPPYPFEVDLEKARRGSALYEQHCLVCHKAGNTTVYQDLGTDPNRSRVLNAEAFDLFARNFVAGAPKGYTYTDSEGATIEPAALPAEEILIDRTTPDKQGYVTSTLEGIWARAPYLHNGSVPALRHLLAPDPETGAGRPERFVRGAISYDETNVGFVWEIEKLEEYRRLDPVAAVFDATLDGASNAGHDEDVEVDGQLRRLDWSGEANRAALDDLLEYLKTL